MDPTPQNEPDLLLGVTGSVACYKACDLTSSLTQDGYNVHVVLTETAADMVAPELFRSLSQNTVYTDLFDRGKRRQPVHIDLAARVDAGLVAPATANFIGKVANGIADDLLSSIIMAIGTRKPVLIGPAMNSNMYQNPFCRDNLHALRDAGYELVEPDDGYMACGDVGTGRLATVDRLVDRLHEHL